MTDSSEQEQSPKSSSRSFFYKFGISVLLAGIPLAIITFLSVTVLWPALNDPESRIYFSGIGIPARQRAAGEAIPVKTAPAALQNLEKNLAASGESVPLQQVDIRPLVSGSVEKVYVVEGDIVRQGQPLIELDRTPFEERVSKAENNLAIAEKTFQALQTATPEKLLELEKDVKIARSRLEEAEARANEINVLADREKVNNVEVARSRLEIAERKLKQLEDLVDEGAVSQFQLYELQDISEARKKELLDALQGKIGTEDQLFSNRDFYLARQNELIAAEQALSTARNEFDKQLATKRLEIDTLKIELSESLRNLSKTVIYAETDGLISQVNIHIGEVADASSTQSLITVTKDVVFKAYIDQAQLNAVKIGDLATVHLVAFPGQSYQGRIVRLNPTIETNALQPLKVGVDRQYTYSVWISLNTLEIPPGLQGYARFSKSQASIIIPESSIIHLSSGESMVMVEEVGRAVVKSVKLGRKFNNNREVIEGLKQGEQLVIYPRALKPGDALEIVSNSNTN